MADSYVTGRWWRGKLRPWDRDGREETVAGRRELSYQSFCSLLGEKKQTKGRNGQREREKGEI